MNREKFTKKKCGDEKAELDCRCGQRGRRCSQKEPYPTLSFESQPFVDDDPDETAPSSFTTPHFGRKEREK